MGRPRNEQDAPAGTGDQSSSEITISKQSKETAHLEEDEEVMARRGKHMEQHQAMGGGNHVLFRLPQVRRDHLITAESFDEGEHHAFSDVTVDSLQDPRALTIRLKTSKTDPFRVGVDVCIGRTDCDLCPVAAVLAYMVLRGRGKGPFFRFKDGSPLTRARYVSEVKRALTKAGVDSSHYSGHSFRSGAATTAAQQGIGDATIKLLGRWKSGAYQLYVKIPRKQLADYSKHLAGSKRGWIAPGGK